MIPGNRSDTLPDFALIIHLTLKLVATLKVYLLINTNIYYIPIDILSI